MSGDVTMYENPNGEPEQGAPGVEGQQAVPPTEETSAKRRGRPPGTKNKAKAAPRTAAGEIPTFLKDRGYTMTTKGLMKFLKVGDEWTRRAFAFEPSIPRVKFAGLYFYKQEEVHAWVAAYGEQIKLGAKAAVPAGLVERKVACKQFGISQSQLSGLNPKVTRVGMGWYVDPTEVEAKLVGSLIPMGGVEKKAGEAPAEVAEPEAADA